MKKLLVITLSLLPLYVQASEMITECENLRDFTKQAVYSRQLGSTRDEVIFKMSKFTTFEKSKKFFVVVDTLYENEIMANRARDLEYIEHTASEVFKACLAENLAAVIRTEQEMQNQ